MKKQLLLLSILFLLVIKTNAQSFGDSFRSVKSKVKNITTYVEGTAITCKLNSYDFESYIIFNFDEDSRLFSYMTMHYLSDNDASSFYRGLYNKYKGMFGNPNIDNERRNCSDCPKLKSKWIKGNETLTINYFSLNGEALIQVLTMRRKGTY